MDRMRIRGGRPLVGEIAISGAKNAALPLLAASLLTDEPLRLTNLPYLADIDAMTKLLAQHGTEIEDTKGNGDGRIVTLTSEAITNHCAPYDLVRKMRASILVLGPLLAREGRAEVSLPGGCAIGTRPVDIHLRGMELLGAEVELKDGYVHAQAPNGLSGAEIVFPKVSVGATENLLMAAALAQGQTRLINAAREPEVVDLGKCLIAMGATIDGLGSDTVTIQGASRLRGTTHRVVADRIETGTYAMAAAITDGELELVGAQAEHLPNVVDLLEEAGVSIQENNRGLKVRRANGRLHGVDAMTEPYPGFPTDLQAQMMALMSLAEGASMITETIFENRFMHVPELARMGANVNVHGSSALVRGREQLTGAPVMATDLRASVSLVLAGLAAEGETVINRVYHLDRGYDHIDEKLSACGAEIDRLAS